MEKKITYLMLIILAAASVVIGNVVPHHHHNDETIICLADDLCETENTCDHNHTADDNCCGFKVNLLTHFGDSRKEDHHCDCHTNHHFHPDLLVLSILFPNQLLSFFDLESRNLEFLPYSNTYLSVFTKGNLGLRAPPVV